MIGAKQLPLAVGLRDDSTLENFLPAVNAEALAAVQSLLDGGQSFVYLCGGVSTGRTHLLESAVDAMTRRGDPVVYVALGGASPPGPDILAGVGQVAALVCLDDIDQIAGDARWEEAIFHLFNEVRSHGGALLVAAQAAPGQVGWALADLASRLCSGLAVNLRPLNDEDRLAVLTFRASRRGIDLPPETGRYLLARSSRRLGDLVELLAELDRAGLVHQRRLTVPFVRQWLQSKA